MKDSVLSEVKLIATNYLQTFESLLHQIDMNALERIVQHLRNARDRGATIYVAGNGGSAATASHWVNDLGKATKSPGRAPMRVNGGMAGRREARRGESARAPAVPTRSAATGVKPAVVTTKRKGRKRSPSQSNQRAEHKAHSTRNVTGIDAGRRG